MPRVKASLPASRETRPAPGAIGKIACTKDFHCVKARDYAVFYKVLIQLK
jgi:hypothetical protein